MNKMVFTVPVSVINLDSIPTEVERTVYLNMRLGESKTWSSVVTFIIDEYAAPTDPSDKPIITTVRGKYDSVAKVGWEVRRKMEFL